MKTSRKIVPGLLESHEQDGNHPLLMSDESQAKMGFIKDMREGKIHLKDYGDSIDVYRAAGSGLKVVCISHFPKGVIDPDDFVKLVGGQADKGRYPGHATVQSCRATSTSSGASSCVE